MYIHMWHCMETSVLTFEWWFSHWTERAHWGAPSCQLDTLVHRLCADLPNILGLRKAQVAGQSGVQLGVVSMGGYPNSWMVYFMENPVKTDDLGYPHFRKHPDVVTDRGTLTSFNHIGNRRARIHIRMAARSECQPLAVCYWDNSCGLITQAEWQTHPCNPPMTPQMNRSNTQPGFF